MSEYFELIHILGQGSFGTVFKALDKVHNRYVALKVLHQEHAQDSKIVQQFFREALVLTRLEHPGIPRVLYLGPFPGQNGQRTYALAQEFFEGQDLAGYLETNGHMPINEAIQLFLQLCPILDYAHARKVIHRDLKPSNIYLTSEGPKILDFGIAKISWVQAVDTAPGGTLLYAAPEQLGKNRKVCIQSDIFSLGVLLYEVITGEHPSQLNLGEYFRWIKENAPPTLLLPDIQTDSDQAKEKQLNNIFINMVKNRPAKRYPTANAVARALRTVIDSSPSSAAYFMASSQPRVLFSWVDPKRDPYYRRRSNGDVLSGPTLRLLQSKRYNNFFDHFVLLTQDEPEPLEQAKRLRYRIESQGLLHQDGEVHIKAVNLDNPWDLTAIAQSLGAIAQQFEQSLGEIEKFAFTSTGTAHAQSAWFLSQALGYWENSTFLQIIPPRHLAPGEDPITEILSPHHIPKTPLPEGLNPPQLKENHPDTPTRSMSVG